MGSGQTGRGPAGGGAVTPIFCIIENKSVYIKYTIKVCVSFLDGVLEPMYLRGKRALEGRRVVSAKKALLKSVSCDQD